jgi:3-oxoacyl-(acyl-carrier-protein) synthase
MNHRVVVTGMGVVSPLGNDVDIFRENLLAGRSGIGLLTLFPAGALPSRMVGECHVCRGAGESVCGKRGFAVRYRSCAG